MELRSRVDKLGKLQAPTAVPPMATPGIRQLVSLEHDQMTHRWFRGAMAFLAFLCFILSIFQVDNYAGNVVLHVLILVLSLAGEVCLVFIYRVKARFAGMTNPATGAINPLHSPYASIMIAEMALWIVMAPPGVSSRAGWAHFLDSLIILRAYVFILFFTLQTTQGVFTRAVATICGFRFNSFYLFRHTFLSRHGLVTAVGFLIAWLGVALLYSKGEMVSYLDAVYFSFSTMAFVAYGDVTPVTWTGRFAAFLSWCLGLLMIGWSVSLLHALVKVSPVERNLHTLFNTNKLCAQIPGEAARTIQRAWKLHAARRDKRNVVSVQFNALLLSTQASSFRTLRREFATAEMSFLRSTYTFEDILTALSRTSSRRTTPAVSPRSPATSSHGGSSGTPRAAHSARRPFSLFKEVKAKPSPQLSRATSGADMTAHSEDASKSDTMVTGSGLATAPAGNRGPVTTVPPLPISLTKVASPASASTPNADITARLSKLDETLNALIRKAERLVPAQRSYTEIAS